MCLLQLDWKLPLGFSTPSDTTGASQIFEDWLIEEASTYDPMEIQREKQSAAFSVLFLCS